MSDSSILLLTQAVEKLTIATERLSNLIESQDRAPGGASLESTEPPAPRAVFVLEELSRVPFPDRFQEEGIRQRHRGVEDGPPEVPEHLLVTGRGRLSNKSPGVDIRVTEAYRSGFWAKCAIETQTPYKPRSLRKGTKKNHWVVLRSSWAEPFRTTSLADLQQICSLGDKDLIAEPFESLIEAEVFCFGALIEVPSLSSCASQNWGMLEKVARGPYASSRPPVRHFLMMCLSVAWPSPFWIVVVVSCLQSLRITWHRMFWLMGPWLMNHPCLDRQKNSVASFWKRILEEDETGGEHRLDTPGYFLAIDVTDSALPSRSCDRP